VKARDFLLGLGAGVSAGYLAARAVQAFRELRNRLPARAADAAVYARTRRAIDVAETIRSTAGFLAFAYGPLAERLDAATEPAPVWLRPAIFAAALSIGSSVLELPAAFVEDFTLERRYGLSEQSETAWILDYTKSAAISTAVLAVLTTLFAAAVRRAPRSWPFLASLGVFPISVAASFLIPLYVMPLFNTFEPVDGLLEKRLRKLAKRFGVGDAEILRMDMSRQTRKANAFVTGIGSTHRIVVGDTLVEKFPENEIEFVVAHELGHYVNRDTWRIIGLGQVLATTLFFVSNALSPQEERERLRDRALRSVQLFATMQAAMLALRPGLLAFSRSREWAADDFAIAATNDAAAGASAFRRLRDQNLADEDPPGWYEFFFSSHPSLRARIEALQS